MSFSTRIKEEITRIDSSKIEKIATLSAIVRNNAIISNEITIHIENNSVARYVFKLFKEIYGVSSIITVRNKPFNKGLSYILEIKTKIEEILSDLSIIDNRGNNLSVPKDYLISDEDALRSYLKGVFIATGSVNDPKTSRYHLELVIDDGEYANFINEVLNNYDLNSRIIKREKNYTVYIKEAEKISDFLRIIKAYDAVLYFEDIRIYRDHKNMTNRLNNCEQANMDKIFLTALNQIKDIEILQKLDIIEMLDDKLQEVIEYRLKYKEASLLELSDIITRETGNKITKSGLNHRFRKIREIVNNIENKK